MIVGNSKSFHLGAHSTFKTLRFPSYLGAERDSYSIEDYDCQRRSPCIRNHVFAPAPLPLALHKCVRSPLKVPCVPKWFSGRFSYSTCTNDFGAATHSERRFLFRLFNRLFRVLPGFTGKSPVIAVRSSTKRNNKIRSCT